MPKLFGTDGIRGEANTGALAPDSVMRIGRAVGLFARQSAETPRVVIGKDTRESGYMIEAALVAGLTSVGADPILLGPLPTPGTSLMTRSLRADLGIMITASHNPHTDNGLKFFSPTGCKLDDAAQLTLQEFHEAKGIDVEVPRMGQASRIDFAHGRYVEAVKQTVPRGLRLNGLKVVLDCANGAGYRCAPEVLWELGATVTTINANPDGRNINLTCGATDTRALRARVISDGADLGLALDGDADRIIACDENGQTIDGDQILATLAVSMREEGKLRNATVAATRVSNLALDGYLKGNGISVIRSDVGDRALAKEMARHDLALGAESSGHVILSDFACTGDGLVGAVQLLALLKSRGAVASDLLHAFDPYPQSHKSIRIDPTNFQLGHSEIQNEIASVESQLRADERVIVRQSGTEPLVRVLVEGPNKINNERNAERISRAIKHAN